MPKTKDEERWEREHRDSITYHTDKLSSHDAQEIIASCNALKDLKAKEAVESLKTLKDHFKISVRAAAFLAIETIEKTS